MDARLEVRTVEERLRAIAGRADALAAAAAAERQASQRAEARRMRRAAGGGGGQRGRRGRRDALTRIEQSWPLADADRQAAEQASRAATAS